MHYMIHIPFSVAQANWLLTSVQVLITVSSQSRCILDATCVYTITLQAAVKHFGWFNYRATKPNSANFKLYRQSDVTKAASGQMWRGRQSGERWDVRVTWQRSALLHADTNQNRTPAALERSGAQVGADVRGLVRWCHFASHTVQMWITPPLCALLFYCFEFFFFPFFEAEFSSALRDSWFPSWRHNKYWDRMITNFCPWMGFHELSWQIMKKGMQPNQTF